MAVDAFLKMTDVKGDSAVKGHVDEIQISGWSWGARQTGTMHEAKGGGAGKADVDNIVIDKVMDKSSPTLLAGCCKGKHYDEAVLTMRKAGDDPLDYLTITMTGVLVSGISFMSREDGEVVHETLTLNFKKFKVSYQPQNDKGAKEGGKVDAEYDIAANA
ncbi:MAG TPA: type VI secretion system tube protein Hcp [Gammaproteobacteria bacterium]|nr:type VI secretion system tube protein Hcp [Gammaproteobacteria bacterium]